MDFTHIVSHNPKEIVHETNQLYFVSTGLVNSTQEKVSGACIGVSLSYV